MRRQSFASVVLAVSLVTPIAAQHPADVRDLPRIDRARPTPASLCGTRARDGTDERITTRTVRADGTIAWFRQEPSLLTAPYAGTLTFAELTVTGDVRQVRFARYDGESRTESLESWSRTRTETSNGRLVSVFEPSWDEAATRHFVRFADRGFDQASAYFGRYLGPEDGTDESVSIYVRLGITGLMPASVVTIDETAQYASHVVNLVIPSFGVERLDDDKGFDLEAAARKFYAYIDDSYDIITFVSGHSHPSQSYAAFHRDVQNAVTGIGLHRFNRASWYGSSGALLGVELFAQGYLGDNELANHELTHTWGHNFDSYAIAGVAKSDGVHPPIMTGGPSMLGIAVPPDLFVGGTDEAPVVERTPVYARQHPFELYAMGLLEPVAFPSIRIFLNQFQFAEARAYVGAPVEPAARTVTLDDVIRSHGPREGPVYREIRRATVVVTRDRLLTADEMAYWNYIAVRQEDPNRTGMFDYNGQPSFDFTTNQQVDLTTGIRPKGAKSAPTPPYQVDFPPFATRECPGVEFDAPVPTRVAIGQRLTLSGRVTATDRSDFNYVTFRYWLRGGTSDRAVRANADVSRSGLFNVQLEFRDGQEGLYAFETFLFWPDSGTQLSRCSLTPVTVTSAIPAAAAVR